MNSTVQSDTSLSTFGVPGPDLPCHPLEVEPGDVVLFHAVYGQPEGRSFNTVKFAAEPATQEHLAILREDDGNFCLLHEEFRNSQRLCIQGMVEKLRGW